VHRSHTAVLAVITFALLALTPLASAADGATVLYDFNFRAHEPQPVIADGAGNFYGMTQEGGVNDAGTLYELSPQQDGSWKLTVLHSFCIDAKECGAAQEQLAFDPAGNLYGIGREGGAYGLAGGGVIYYFVHAKDGSWTTNILHSFGAAGDGFEPTGPLVVDGQGNLYGITAGGGNDCLGLITGCGIVYELMPGPDDHWTYKVLHKFNGVEGAIPTGLTQDLNGNLYGTTGNGGAHVPCEGTGAFGCGAVFEMSPQANGTWHFTVLHSFDGPDGAGPNTLLFSDTSGNLYGATDSGGDVAGCNCGVVFQLRRENGYQWRETVLHTTHGRNYGLFGLAIDPADNLYGTTYQGGNDTGRGCHPEGCGTVYKLTPTPRGYWDVTWLFSFNGEDGRQPGNLIFGNDGNLYGVTPFGGAHDDGTFFEITP
jgi:uncharacterized repeat protein (TIGR03803 family)